LVFGDCRCNKCILFIITTAKLHCEGVDLARVAEKFGTPLYVYSAGTILDHYTRLDAALAPLEHLILLRGQSELESRDSQVARTSRRGIRYRFR